MTIDVYHVGPYRGVFLTSNELLKGSFNKIDDAPFTYTHVATVNTDDVDYAYELTNTIERYWWLNHDVEAHVRNTRSTSVGDVLVKSDGSKWLCCSLGWEEFS